MLNLTTKKLESQGY